jgi:hypothetical protein
VQFELKRNLCVSHLFVEAFVLIFSHVFLVPVPNCLQVVYQSSIQLYRETDELGVLFENLLDLELLAEVSSVASKLKRDSGATVVADVVSVLYLVFSSSV